ncbi:MAG: GatB/YqeY domain-containing protein [Synergistaceae bacterium]|jgi:uncharacterized protein YqeY|nr:GatB/YqeY domain-containing protein [Synergistaceae bacterium]
MACPVQEQIQRDLVSAMKSHDERKLSVLRMLKASIQLASTEKGRNAELSDDDIHALVRRGIKQREEAANLYKTCKANERAEEEAEEARILSGYLPSQLDDTELDALIRRVVSSLNAEHKDMGRVIGAVMKEVSGRADGKRVREVAGKILG